MNIDRNSASGAIVECVGICSCTNTQLERGETCGLDICPNAPRPPGTPGLARSRASRRTKDEARLDCPPTQSYHVPDARTKED